MIKIYKTFLLILILILTSHINYNNFQYIIKNKKLKKTIEVTESNNSY
jgi:hypothetical protein